MNKINLSYLNSQRNTVDCKIDHEKAGKILFDRADIKSTFDIQSRNYLYSHDIY